MADENRAAQPQAQEKEDVYSREELLAGASGFGVQPEVISGALALAGRKQMTRSQMEAAIKEFRERKV